ncbi:MAG: polyphenol oxidase family protein [Actinobacteria bacterium]|nr:polyphenol oxidase family protein [Actinomycetota bacterium]
MGPARVVFTGRTEGDLGHGGAYVHEVRPDVAERRRAVVDLPWTWLRQVHGDRVVRVDAPGAGAGEAADAAVTRQSGAALAVLTADCAPVALASDEGVIGVVHAGWRGVVGGVVQKAVGDLRALGATRLQAVMGPCIRSECYEFGAGDLETVAGRWGPQVVARTRGGNPALDLPAAVRSALAEESVDDVEDVGICTACSANHYSWRARGEQERQAAVVWK